MTIRKATTDDAAALLGIYAPYVEHTAITFEYDVPSVEEFRQRIADTSRRYPYLVAERSSSAGLQGKNDGLHEGTAGRPVGFAYASAFKERAAYQWAVETSIYVDEHHKHRGTGRLLHEALEAALRRQGILNMNACIAYAETEDEYLTLDSVHFHRRLGYSQVAHFHQCGRKFGRWYDMIWMEKIIGEHS